MSNVKSGYIRVVTNSGVGYICVAVDMQPKGVAGEYKAAFSFCSPKDKFNRKIAYRMARGRLSVWNENETSPLVRWIGSTQSISAGFLVALDVAIKDGRVPGWVARAVRSHKISFGLNLNNQGFYLSEALAVRDEYSSHAAQ